MTDRENTPPTETKTRSPFLAALLLGAGLLVLVASLCIHISSANDLFWQLRAGEDIWRTHHIPHQDTYSWTRRGTPWVAHEWLTFVIFWVMYHLNGYGGVWLLQVLLVSVTFVILYLFLFFETGRVPLTAFLLALLAAFVVSPFFQPRPQLITYLLTTFVVGLVLSAQRLPRSSICLWCLPPLFALWANLHAGVVLGVGCLFAFAVGNAVQGVLEDKTNQEERARLSRSARTLAAITVLCTAATLLNPYGWHLYENLVDTIQNATAMNIVSEWLSPDFHDPFGQMLEIFLGISLLVLALSRERKSVAEILILCLLVNAALTASRNVPILALVGTLLIAKHAQSAVSRGVNSRTKGLHTDSGSFFGTSPSPIIAAAIALALSAVGIARASDILRPTGLLPGSLASRSARISFGLDSFPERACRFIENEQLPPSIRFYNIYSDGGYLIWRLQSHPVFIDGRADIYFGPMLDRVSKMGSLPYLWEDTLSDHGRTCDAILSSVTDKQSRLFLTAPDWALVYADTPLPDAPGDELHERGSLFFLRRTPGNAEFILRCRRDCPTLAHLDDVLPPGDYAALK